MVLSRFVDAVPCQLVGGCVLVLLAACGHDDGGRVDAPDTGSAGDVAQDAADGDVVEDVDLIDFADADADATDGDTESVADTVELAEPSPDTDLPGRRDPPGMACVRDTTCTRLVLVAHRGAHKAVPENSLASIREAARLGMDLAEVDVRTTADGVLVVMHDTTVDRTTDLEGDVAGMNWEALQGATLRGADPGDAETQRVPTLDDVLRLAVALEIGLYLDVKDVEVDPLLAAIDAAAAWDWVLVRKSVDFTAQVVAARPQALVLPAVGDAAALDGWPDALQTVGQVELGRPTANAAFVASANGRGLRVQQDVLAGGDLTGSLGIYTGYRSFVDVGVWMLQTNECAALLYAVGVYEQTGVFPDGAPSR